MTGQKNGLKPQSVNLETLISKIKTLQDLQTTLTEKADIVKMSLLYERLRNLPKYLKWLQVIEDKLINESNINYLSNSQLIKLLGEINRNTNEIIRLFNELTTKKEQYVDNRQVNITINQNKLDELSPISREKLRDVIDAIIGELEVLNKDVKKEG